MSANLFPSKKLTPQQVGLLSAAVPSPLGDALGLLADGVGYAQDPSSLTPRSGLLSLAAMLPGIPNKRILGPDKELAGAIRKQVESVTGVAPDISVSWRTPDVARLDRLVVLPSQRGKGVGSLAVKSATDYADQSGVTMILNATGDFGGSKAGQRRLYKRFGFVDYNPKTMSLPKGAVTPFDEGLMVRFPAGVAK